MKTSLEFPIHFLKIYGRVLLSLPSSLADLIRQSGDLRLISQHGWL
jgi:hypothetical protein